MAIAPPLANIARLISRTEFERMIDAGLFADERVELWKGVIVRMGWQKSPHAAAVQRLSELFMIALVPGRRASVRVQLPIALSDDSQPLPDLAVVASAEYRDAHPVTAFLVIEVSDTSLAADRSFKADGYAAAGIPEYWVVDVQGRTIEVHRDPSPRGYRARTVHSRGEICTALAFPDLPISVTDVVG